MAQSGVKLHKFRSAMLRIPHRLTSKVVAADGGRDNAIVLAKRDRKTQGSATHVELLNWRVAGRRHVPQPKAAQQPARRRRLRTKDDDV